MYNFHVSRVHQVFLLWPQVGSSSYRGGWGAGPKGTTNRLGIAHTPIRPRAKMHHLGALGLPPFPDSPQCRLSGGLHPAEGAFFF